MNELHKAYYVLGLEPGAGFDTIKRRYRILALAWHPDRMTKPDAKKEAEEELKKINNYFEKLKKHFESEHQSGPSCRCQPAAAGPPPNHSNGAGGSDSTGRNGSSSSGNANSSAAGKPGSAAGNQNSSSRSSAGSAAGANTGQSDADRQRREEQAARKRSEERERKAAEEEAARRAASAAMRATERQKDAEDAEKEETLTKDEPLRWKCSLLIGVTFLILIGYCWAGCAARDLVRWIGKRCNSMQEAPTHNSLKSLNQGTELTNQLNGMALR